jgi:hypothetical protein
MSEGRLHEVEIIIAPLPPPPFSKNENRGGESGGFFWNITMDNIERDRGAGVLRRNYPV